MPFNGIGGGYRFSERAVPRPYSGDKVQKMRQKRRGFGLRSRPFLRFFHDRTLRSSDLVGIRGFGPRDRQKALVPPFAADPERLKAPKGKAEIGGEGMVPTRADPKRRGGGEGRLEVVGENQWVRPVNGVIGDLTGVGLVFGRVPRGTRPKIPPARDRRGVVKMADTGGPDEEPPVGGGGRAAAGRGLGPFALAFLEVAFKAVGLAGNAKWPILEGRVDGIATLTLPETGAGWVTGLVGRLRVTTNAVRGGETWAVREGGAVCKGFGGGPTVMVIGVTRGELPAELGGERRTRRSQMVATLWRAAVDAAKVITLTPPGCTTSS